MRSRTTDYAFVGALALAGVLYLQLVHRPAVRGVDAKSRRLMSTQAEICKSDDFTRGLDDLERYLQEFEQALADLDRLVPGHIDSDDRVREITGVASRCGLSPTSIRPDQPVPRGSVMVHPLTVKVCGGYEQIVRFLFEAESLPRHTRVTQLTIEREPEAPARLLAEIELTSHSVARDAAGA
ncbi:MAG: type 4a pilus biogenesis protein PilO, partial [Planctomycetes bacterium]|nr:type 4a pilus biogenesis protein PilO [Planctomycetota bacterium]